MKTEGQFRIFSYGCGHEKLIKGKVDKGSNGINTFLKSPNCLSIHKKVKVKRKSFQSGFVIAFL